MRYIRRFWILFCFTPSLVFGEGAAVVDDQALTAEMIASNTLIQKFGMTAVSTPVQPTPTPQGAAKGVAVAQTVSQASKTMMTDIQTCISRTERANSLCLESSAPALGSFISEYGLLIQGTSTAVQSIAGQCSNIGKLLKMGNVALGAFQVTCASAQVMCASACGKVEISAKNYQAVAQTARNAAIDGSVTAETAEIHAQNALSVQAKIKTAVALCAKYKIKAESAAGGVILALTSMQAAKNCEKQNMADSTLDCTNPKSPMYGSKNCQCGRGELPQADCQNINISAALQKAPPVTGGNTVTASLGEASPPGISGGEATNQNGGNPAPASNLAGAPTEGGGGGGLGGGGGSSSGGAQDGAINPRRLKANVLGGFSGGGSGGGGAGPGYGEVDANLKPYMPGGEKDPTRSIASQFAKEVSAPAGRSNWEKVRSRYRDNTRTLMNQ